MVAAIYALSTGGLSQSSAKLSQHNRDSCAETSVGGKSVPHGLLGMLQARLSKSRATTRLSRPDGHVCRRIAQPPFPAIEDVECCGGCARVFIDTAHLCVAMHWRCGGRSSVDAAHRKFQLLFGPYTFKEYESSQAQFTGPA